MDSVDHSPKPHVAIFPLITGMGHSRPTVEFAKRLQANHGFSITFIICKWRWKAQQSLFIQSLASSGFDIRFVDIPADEENDKDEIIAARANFMVKAKSQIGDEIHSLNSSSPISAVVTDFFLTAVLDVTAKQNIPTYLFVPASASFVCLMLHLPQLVAEIDVSFKDTDIEVEIPGLPRIPARDLPTPIQDRSGSAFDWFVHHASRFKDARGIFINTFAEVEVEAIKTLKTLTEGKILSSTAMPSFYPIGPLMLVECDSPPESTCLKWLDEQPPSSVLFVAFGSGVVLSNAQITDLAFGLESSNHRFLWVLRGFESGDSSLETDVSQLLPEGFESRTRDRGFVVLNWAPQIPILSHPSTGGFLSHCGWNSTLESISCGVPMIAWPVFAEQRMNKVILMKEIKIAIDLKMESDGFVRREEVERAVKELMEGEGGLKARENVRELKEKAKSATMEGGSSVKAIATAAAHLSQNPCSMGTKDYFHVNNQC